MHEMKITFPAGKRVNAELGPFTIQTDQSKEEGGEGSAPQPFMLFLASLGTCAGIYVLGFCQSRGLSAEGIYLTQSNQWDTATKRVSQVEIQIHVPLDFPEKYREALVRSAEHCTVKRNILAPPEFLISAVVD